MGIESIGVVGWAVLGILPAVLWTFVSVRGASRRRDRQFVRRGSLLVWGLVAVYIAALRAAPEAMAAYVLLAFCVTFALVVGVLEWRRSQLRVHDFPGSYLFIRRAPFGR
jgi:hypothetical protein